MATINYDSVDYAHLFSPEDRDLLKKDARGDLDEKEDKRTTRTLVDKRARVAELKDRVKKMKAQVAPSQGASKVDIGPGTRIQAPDVQQIAGNASSEEALGLMDKWVEFHRIVSDD